MLQVSRIESIKDLALQGKSIAEIARIQGIDYNLKSREIIVRAHDSSPKIWKISR